MDDASHLLPDEPAALKAIIAAVTGQRDEASRQRDEASRQRDARDEQARRLQQRIDELELSKLRLEVELLRLKKWYYGPRAGLLIRPTCRRKFNPIQRPTPLPGPTRPRPSAACVKAAGTWPPLTTCR
jgi:hypothetical protein